MLVRCGAEVNLTDNSGLTALLIAARYEYEDILKVLLKYVSDLNPSLSGLSQDLLFFKIILNACICASLLCKLCCLLKYQYSCLFFFRSGAETHHRNTNGKTVFHLAAMSQNYKYTLQLML